MKALMETRISDWKTADVDPFFRDLVESVLSRVAQGMDDEGLLAYLDYRKRGVPAGSEERDVIDDVTRAFLMEGSRLRDDVNSIRQAEARAEQERLRRAREAARNLTLMPGVSDDTYRLWRLEQRYKNSLIPPGARGGGRSGRGRKKEARRSRGDTTPLEVVIAKHNERLFRELARKRARG